LGNVALQPSWPIAVRINLFSKNHSFLWTRMEINFIRTCSFRRDLQLCSSNFFIWSYLGLQKLIYCPDLSFRYPDLDNISIFWASRWLQMKKFEPKSCRSRWKLQVFL
jgi:hypothetical protein